MSSQRRGFRKLWPRSGASLASDPSQPTVASLVRHSPKPSLAKIGTDGNAFKVAWIKFFDGLPPEERKAFIDAYESVSPEDLVQEIRDMDRKDSRSAPRRLVDPTKDFLTILDQLLKMTPSFESLGIPDVASIIIGGARLTIKMALNYVEFFEKLAAILGKLTAHLAHLRQASKLESMVLIQESTANVYVGILKFYHQAYNIFKNRDHQDYTLGHFRRFGRVQWESFDVKFGEIEREIQDSLEALSQAKGTEALHQISNLQDESTKHTQILSEQQRHEYLEVISFVDFDPLQRNNLKKRWPGTGDWLLNHTRFQQWFLGKGPQILWCHGQPGAGKSVLSSIVVDYIKKHKNADTENVGNAFIYFRYGNMETNSPEKMIAAILKQMSAQLESFPKDLVDLLSRCYRNAEVPSPEESTKAIIALSSCLTQTFVVMDALDECKEESRGPIFELISALTTKIPSAKFFITSRPEPRIRDDFDTLRTQNFEIDVAETRNDIAEYVKGQLEYLTGPFQPGEPRKRRKLCAIQDQTKDEIFRTLTRRADGVFLWVDLQLDSICQQRNDEDILEVLSSLPEGLYNTYERILEQIKRESKPLQRLASKCLMWVLKAKRKFFRVEWLLCAIATDSDFTTFGQILAKHEKYTRQEILDACHNLLAIVGSIVSPVHYSLAEFIELEKTIKDSAFAELQDQQLMEARMAKTCLVFLKLYHSEDGPVMWLKEWDKRFRFYEYCAQYFDQHVIAAGKERFEDVREHLYSLLSLEASALGRIASNRRGCSVEEATVKDFIYITQLYELSAVAEDERWNTQALHQSTLSAACATGPVGKVRTLLDFEAIPVSTHHSPLQAAVLNHQGREMVELLLDSGVADANDDRSDYMNCRFNYLLSCPFYGKHQMACLIRHHHL